MKCLQGIINKVQEKFNEIILCCATRQARNITWEDIRRDIYETYTDEQGKKRERLKPEFDEALTMALKSLEQAMPKILKELEEETKANTIPEMVASTSGEPHNPSK
jgi:phosphoenolpyruvate carboxylase